ncbi:ST6B1 Sulfotransferase, partial [Calyptomena viridis]|nr:ST6B1 Sulfotransferase [Calyptomena viridis]
RMDKSRKKFTDIVDKAIVASNSVHLDELLFSYKGILYPVLFCSPEVFRALESFEARSDDIILAGYPKSGTNWLSQILSDLVTIFEKKTQGREIRVNDELEEFPYLEILDTEKYERMTKLPSPRFMLTHLLPENLPKSIFKHKVKVSVATSFYHFSNDMSPLPSYKTWDDFFIAFMTKKSTLYDSVCINYSIYADEENVMTITYEDLKEVSKVLSVKMDQHYLVYNRIRMTDIYEKRFLDFQEFLCFSEGGVSDWKNLFNEDQNEKMDKAFEEYVGGTKLGKKLKYEVYCKA